MTKQKNNIYVNMLRKLVRDCTKDYAVKVYLFGSRAKGKEHAVSDIDIAILPLKPLPIGFMAHLKETIEDSTIPYSVDVVDLSEVDPAFREKILAEGIEWKD